jgi:hypothetical protein
LEKKTANVVKRTNLLGSVKLWMPLPDIVKRHIATSLQNVTIKRRLNIIVKRRLKTSLSKVV